MAQAKSIHFISQELESATDKWVLHIWPKSFHVRKDRCFSRPQLFLKNAGMVIERLEIQSMKMIYILLPSPSIYIFFAQTQFRIGNLYE